METIIHKLREAGMEIEKDGQEVNAAGNKRIKCGCEDTALPRFSNGHAGPVHGLHEFSKRAERHF
jgi:hypothetical protein